LLDSLRSWYVELRNDYARLVGCAAMAGMYAGDSREADCESLDWVLPDYY